MQISRIRLSDKTSRLRPRHVVPKAAQAYEPEVPVEVREWIAPAPSSPDFVLGAQPPAQPHRCVSVERPIRLVDGSYLEVVRPSAQRAVHFAHQRCGLLGRGMRAFHSITSSAAASSVGGISMPSAEAVLRLMANLIAVACSIGKSPGFAPLRMRSM